MKKKHDDHATKYGKMQPMRKKTETNRFFYTTHKPTLVIEIIYNTIR